MVRSLPTVRLPLCVASPIVNNLPPKEASPLKNKRLPIETSFNAYSDNKKKFSYYMVIRFFK